MMPSTIDCVTKGVRAGSECRAVALLELLARAARTRIVAAYTRPVHLRGRLRAKRPGTSGAHDDGVLSRKDARLRRLIRRDVDNRLLTFWRRLRVDVVSNANRIELL